MHTYQYGKRDAGTGRLLKKCFYYRCCQVAKRCWQAHSCDNGYLPLQDHRPFHPEMLNRYHLVPPNCPMRWRCMVWCSCMHAPRAFGSQRKGHPDIFQSKSGINAKATGDLGINPSNYRHQRYVQSSTHPSIQHAAKNTYPCFPHLGVPGVCATGA